MNEMYTHIKSQHLFILLQMYLWNILACRYTNNVP